MGSRYSWGVCIHVFMGSIYSWGVFYFLFDSSTPVSFIVIILKLTGVALSLDIFRNFERTKEISLIWLSNIIAEFRWETTAVKLPLLL